MSKKLSNQEWEEYINKYYKSENSKTINDFCREQDISKQQFHYHKKRLKKAEKSNEPVFHAVKINNIMDTSTIVESTPSEIKIIIGNATIGIPVSETTLISSIIKELASQC